MLSTAPMTTTTSVGDGHCPEPSNNFVDHITMRMHPAQYPGMQEGFSRTERMAVAEAEDAAHNAAWGQPRITAESGFLITDKRDLDPFFTDPIIIKFARFADMEPWLQMRMSRLVREGRHSFDKLEEDCYSDDPDDQALDGIIDRGSNLAIDLQEISFYDWIFTAVRFNGSMAGNIVGTISILQTLTQYNGT